MRGFFTAALILASSVSLAQSADKLPSTKFGYSELRSLVTDRDLRSVSATLALVPDSLRSNVVLMTKSRSLQGASALQPRAILFNDDASLIVSMTDDHRGSERLEIMSFAGDRYAFKTIQFTGEGGRALVNETPTNCFGCHGRLRDDLRPVWDPGQIWRGAIGQRDDVATVLELEAVRKLGGSYARLKPTFGGDHSMIENRPNLRLGLLLMRQQVKRVVRLAGGVTALRARLCANAPAVSQFESSVVANWQRFITPVYGDVFTQDFMKTEGPSLISTLATLRDSGLDLDEVAMTIERQTNAVFDGSFPFRSLVFGELARALGAPSMEFQSIEGSSLGLKTSPGLEAIDGVGKALATDSIAAICQQ